MSCHQKQGSVRKFCLDARAIEREFMFLRGYFGGKILLAQEFGKLQCPCNQAPRNKKI
jgi:hypothetical protein